MVTATLKELQSSGLLEKYSLTTKAFSTDLACAVDELTKLPEKRIVICRSNLPSNATALDLDSWQRRADWLGCHRQR